MSFHSASNVLVERVKMADTGSDSPPLVPKGAYNIDWDNFDDSIDPFATKSKVVNDLPIATDDLEPLKVKKTASSTSAKSKTTFAKNKAKAAAAKKTAATKSTPVKEVTSQVDPEPQNNSTESDDPFKASRALANSPTSNTDADSSKPAVANSPVTVMTSGEGDADSDPFKPRKAIANSPVSNRKSISNDAAADDVMSEQAPGDAPEPKKSERKSLTPR